jgi:sulfate adenylyltransferase subunit 1
MDLLRLATAGSVDDGKSTLIGRLLFDSRAVLADQLAQVEAASAGDGVDLALLTDGLRAEREQGITIDVAYRHFATAKRRFILADTPGHAQYTRNMVTGASTAELALVLVDVRHGMTEQTRRHLTIARLLGVRHVLVAVNKMDLAGYAEEAFDDVVRAVLEFTARLRLHDVGFIPLSALHGDNVLERSSAMPWYVGPPLLEYLETVPVGEALEQLPARLPVQTVLRGEQRWYAGRLAAGTLRAGDEVVVLPAGVRTRVAGVAVPGEEVGVVEAPLSVAVRLADQVDVGRGDVIAAADDAPGVTRELEAAICWVGDRPARAGDRFLLKQGTSTVRARLDTVQRRLDVLSGESSPADGLALNDIAIVTVRTGADVVVDPYARIRGTGGFILIDEQTNETVAAGMVR